MIGGVKYKILCQIKLSSTNKLKIRPKTNSTKKHKNQRNSGFPLGFFWNKYKPQIEKELINRISVT